MQTIIDIIGRAGGWRPDLCLRIENPPYIPLVIEALDESGPLGLPAISVAHYTERSDGLIGHPEMHFEIWVPVGGKPTLDPFYWRNDFVAAEQTSRFATDDEYTHLYELHARHVRFAAEWNEVLARQRFVEVFATHCAQL